MSMLTRASVSQRVERIILFGVLILVCVAAWGVLYFNRDLAHITHSFGHSHHMTHTRNYSLLFIAGWMVMTIAMMLPTTLPVMALFHKVISQHKNRILLLVLVIAGYTGTWLVFGVLIFIQIKILGLFVSTNPGLSSYSWTFAPLIILASGFFQFSSLKNMCVKKCRSPLDFVTERLKGKQDGWNSLRLGIDHGLFCIGCCWALMLLMFAVGFGSLFWMLILAFIMGIEKNVSWGQKITKPIGICLITIGFISLFLSYVKVT